ncbi:IS1595 family transposase [Roseateles saccharophilus]|uniref:Transposase-like protein n=1 Tax=Roseateles saccharophilus TaxID=304 RepID=A0A4R3VKD0_ROSSA|nr:IS1595 family transposase [Roseateles saccharophilus]MDG0831174.1 IS1595 family transposase [Roseateles saccharophilus]TCV04294.1 transposase-like protein [Roseateles saccharophilus]
MRDTELKAWLDCVDHLNPEQRQQLRRRLDAATSLDEVDGALQRLRDKHPQCPRCQSLRVVRNGHADGRQRYKCRACTRSFNALTCTPLARLRHRDRWLAQTDVLVSGLSARQAAQQLRVHRTTAFRWRHRFLTLPQAVKAGGLQGVAEADETYELRSFKGQRQLLAQQSRKARHRGGHAAKRGLSDEQVPVLVLRDRSGATTDFVLPCATKAAVKQVLPQALAADAVLCTDGSGTLAAAARELGIEHQALNLSKGERRRGAWHIQNVNAYHSRFKTWMRRFNGVATSNLQNYLGWFRALDRNAQTGAKSASFLDLARGV